MCIRDSINAEYGRVLEQKMEGPAKRKRQDGGTTFVKIVKDILAEYGREDGFAEIWHVLQGNWIASVHDWNLLAPQLKQGLHLPALFVQRLNDEAIKMTLPNPKRRKLLQPAKLDFDLNSALCTPEFLEKARRDFVAATPFPHYVFSDLLSDDAFVHGLKEDIQSLEFFRKRNDLYDFAQTNDFKTSQLPHISAFRDLIYSQKFRNILSHVTGIDDLEATVDMSAAIYSNGSTLLCHDDHVEGRRIAFIYYLVPPGWDMEVDGGGLGLFGVDENKQPDLLQQVINPQWNSFAFFNVTEISWHQVCEVINDNSERVSISGWFHGPPLIRAPQYEEPDLEFTPFTNATTSPTDWINPIYFEDATKQKLREVYKTEYTIALQDFLQPSKYEALLNALHEGPWKLRGPANRRHYEILEDDMGEGAEHKKEKEKEDEDSADIIRSFQCFFKSTEFAQFIFGITDVKVTKHQLQVRKFRRGAYTLVHDIKFAEEDYDADDENDEADDGELETEDPIIDVVLCCATNPIPEEAGGYAVYLDSESELVSNEAHPNNLTIIMRDSKTMRFIKYLNNMCSDIRYDFSLISTN
eukprot:TRINITY_DN8499_c0_g1_i3.p1 TRINITY_DN8499_c0_g1~~TRINITY_DN8499_c0_g1_i3.p1  ORF type:complete len:582 (-),score=116.33 TRINITY_DN8499_c0_g1_i3:49-1794(-)